MMFKLEKKGEKEKDPLKLNVLVWKRGEKDEGNKNFPFLNKLIEFTQQNERQGTRKTQDSSSFQINQNIVSERTLEENP